MSDASRIVFHGRQQVALETFEHPTPGPGEVLGRTMLTLMSTGTENTVFNRAFAPGTHWERWVKYPFHPGYTAVGEVTTVGPGVTGLRPGDRVACRASHASHAVVKAEDCFPVAEALP